MRSVSVFVFLLIFSLLVQSCRGDEPERKQIAITFDDAPVMRFYSHPSQWHRQLIVDSLTTVLRRYHAPATIFVVGSLLENPEGEELLVQWLQGGVDLANHSMNHTSFNDLTYREGVDEIVLAQEVLAPFAEAHCKTIKYFRFPFLEEGTALDRKQAWLRYLDASGLAPGRVSIGNDDWDYDIAYSEAELAEDWELRYQIGQEYMQHMRESFAYWESVSEELFGRNVKHVLLLHANRINRDYLGLILWELQADGYEFISLNEAYQDPLYSAYDAWVSETGTSFLENIRQTRSMNAR